MKLNRVLALALAAACLLALSACRPKQEDGSAASGSSSAESSADTSQAPAASLPDGSEPDASQPEPAPAPQEPEQPAPPPAPKPKPQPQPKPKPVPEQPKEISFPYAIPDTTLVVEAVKSYDGIFLEDGSDTPIKGVAAVIVKNTGKQVVDFAQLQMDGAKTHFTFEFSGVAAGASIVAMEKNKAPAVDQKYNSISADAAFSDGFELSKAALNVEETEDGQLKITNLSGNDIPCVRVFYKFYIPDQNTYVGGITYVAKILDLKAGDSAQVLPSHYAAGSSKVIMAKIYQTAED